MSDTGPLDTSGLITVPQGPDPDRANQRNGIDDGYEAGLGDIFDQDPVVGVVVILLFATGPIVGMLVARTLRRRREHSPR